MVITRDEYVLVKYNIIISPKPIRKKKILRAYLSVWSGSPQMESAGRWTRTSDPRYGLCTDDYLYNINASAWLVRPKNGWTNARTDHHHSPGTAALECVAPTVTMVAVAAAAAPAAAAPATSGGGGLACRRGLSTGAARAPRRPRGVGRPTWSRVIGQGLWVGGWNFESPPSRAVPTARRTIIPPLFTPRQPPTYRSVSPRRPSSIPTVVYNPYCPVVVVHP